MGVVEVSNLLVQETICCKRDAAVNGTMFSFIACGEFVVCGCGNPRGGSMAVRQWQGLVPTLVSYWHRDLWWCARFAVARR